MITIEQILSRCTEEQLDSIMDCALTIMRHMEFVTGKKTVSHSFCCGNSGCCRHQLPLPLPRCPENGVYGYNLCAVGLLCGNTADQGYKCGSNQEIIV